MKNNDLSQINTLPIEIYNKPGFWVGYLLLFGFLFVFMLSFFKYGGRDKALIWFAIIMGIISLTGVIVSLVQLLTLSHPALVLDKDSLYYRDVLLREHHLEYSKIESFNLISIPDWWSENDFRLTLIDNTKVVVILNFLNLKMGNEDFARILQERGLKQE